MANPMSIIACVVGIIGCVIGVATFVSAQLVRAKEDGKLMEKVDHLIKGLDELKDDTKTRNTAIDETLDSYGKDITDLKARMKIVEGEVFHEHRG